jgi:chromosome segregation ATPase
MSIKYYYVNDLNKLYNAAVGNKTDGGEYHTAMMEAHDNLEEYIQNIEHWRDTALQLSKNLGTAQNKIDNLEQDYVISNRELLILQVEISRLTAELAELRTRWIPVSERLPELNVSVLTRDYKNVIRIERRTRYWSEENSNFKTNNVTHWMPLPPPPEDTDADN